MKDWYKMASQGRENLVADESCCQVILHKYPHVIIDSRYNRSCKYDDPKKEDTRIVHFHGKKHCRLNTNGKIPYNGELWLNEYEEIIKADRIMFDIYIDHLKDSEIMKGWTKKRINTWLTKKMKEKEEVYFTAEETVEHNFADTIFGADGTYDWDTLTKG